MLKHHSYAIYLSDFESFLAADPTVDQTRNKSKQNKTLQGTNADSPKQEERSVVLSLEG